MTIAEMEMMNVIKRQLPQIARELKRIADALESAGVEPNTWRDGEQGEAGKEVW